ncbi:aminotransferase class III-fold pyridoxal phosphate-dependent enzyme [Candidatus Peregrinibacteria bacterium]|nr:aminotransferase class III-fold pyridoxal phosphate-dependent enzyme [Candidatus Peregrinibacteria bacterium]
MSQEATDREVWSLDANFDSGHFVEEDQELSEQDVRAIEDKYGVSGILKSWGGQYPPRIVVNEREGFHVKDGQARRLADLHQAILSMSVGWKNANIEALIAKYKELYPGVDMVDTTQVFPPATLLKRDLVEACRPYGDFRALLASSGTSANEQAIRLCMGALGGPQKTQLIVMEGCYGGADLSMNANCIVPGWKGDTSLPESALVIKRDGSNLDEVMDALPEGVKPIWHTEDGIQGVGGFHPWPPKLMQDVAKRVREKGGKIILDNVQTFVRNGSGMLGVDRWGEKDESGQLKDYCKPDAITFAKGLGNGRAVAATLVSEDTLKEVAAGGNPGATFDTFSQPLEGIAAARQVMKMVRDLRLWENAGQMGAKFREQIGDLATDFPGVVTEVFGEGALVGVRLTTGAQVLKALELAPTKGLLFAKGGMKGEVVRAPLPFNATSEFVDEVSGKMREVVRAVT